jgi:hypothetical protein
VLAAELAVVAGAHVIGTGSAANHAYLRSIGITPVLYGEGLADRVLALAPKGVNAVLDCHGKGVLATTAKLGSLTIADRSDSGAHRGGLAVVAPAATDLKRDQQPSRDAYAQSCIHRCTRAYIGQILDNFASRRRSRHLTS